MVNVVANLFNEKNGEKVKGHDTDVVLRRLQIAREVYARDGASMLVYVSEVIQGVSKAMQGHASDNLG